MGMEGRSEERGKVKMPWKVEKGSGRGKEEVEKGKIAGERRGIAAGLPVEDRLPSACSMM